MELIFTDFCPIDTPCKNLHSHVGDNVINWYKSVNISVILIQSLNVSMWYECPYLIKFFCIYYQHIFTELGETL